MRGNATRVLIVDDEENQRVGLASMVASWGFAAETAGDGQEALDKLSTFPAHVMVTDLMMPRMDGFELLRRLSAQGCGPPAIVLTAFGNIETAIATMHDLGAFWFLEKPIEPRALRVLLERAASQQRLVDEAERLKRQLSYQGVLGELVGRSAADAGGLLADPAGGAEQGRGADHRRERHRQGTGGARDSQPESARRRAVRRHQLRGHAGDADGERAVRPREGRVHRRAASAAPAASNWRRTARCCSTRSATCRSARRPSCCACSKTRACGGWAARARLVVDVRVIAATNTVLADALKKNELREDLYYRLNVFHINLPPLRERMDDLPLLCEALLRDLNRKHGTRVVEIAAEVMEQFRRHPWPGNVRELRNMLERAVILAGEGTIAIEHLPSNFNNIGGAARAWTMATRPRSACASARPSEKPRRC